MKLSLQDSSTRPSNRSAPCGADSTERRLATGNFKGQLQTWDLENIDEPLTSTPAHTGIVNAIDGGGGKASKNATALCQAFWRRFYYCLRTRRLEVALQCDAAKRDSMQTSMLHIHRMAVARQRWRRPAEMALCGCGILGSTMHLLLPSCRRPPTRSEWNHNGRCACSCRCSSSLKVQGMWDARQHDAPVAAFLPKAAEKVSAMECNLPKDSCVQMNCAFRPAGEGLLRGGVWRHVPRRDAALLAGNWLTEPSNPI